MSIRERLIVDDREDARSQARRITEYGMKEIKPVVVTTVAEALEKLRGDETFYDIVTDFHLLDGNSTSIINVAMSKNPPIPVILWTNDVDSGRRIATEAKQRGQNLRFVDKTGNIQDLINKQNA